MINPVEITVEHGVLVRRGFHRVDVGDIDQNRNLKIRMFIGPGLRPVFEDMQEQLQFRQMGIDEGIAPGQYYQEFNAFPREYGYDEALETELRVTLKNALVDGRDGPTQRLVIETRGVLNSREVIGPAPAVGFDPPLGSLAVAGRSRVIHMLTRPRNPPGDRSVVDVPRNLEFLRPQDFEGEFPTIDTLRRVPSGYEPVFAETQPPLRSVWTMANSDVFLHVHAREYLYAMENRMGVLAADAGLPLSRISPTGSRVIFRRPGMVGERFELRCDLYRNGAKLLALGSFHKVIDGKAEERPASFLRFDAKVG